MATTVVNTEDAELVVEQQRDGTLSIKVCIGDPHTMSTATHTFRLDHKAKVKLDRGMHYVVAKPTI